MMSMTLDRQQQQMQLRPGSAKNNRYSKTSSSCSGTGQQQLLVAGIDQLTLTGAEDNVSADGIAASSSCSSSSAGGVVEEGGRAVSTGSVLSNGSSDGEMEIMRSGGKKEKTPMCLINELARFNKIRHQYSLLDEQGPAHRKTFYVKLRLGEEEEFLAEGQSIKKAQHAAAANALKNTKYSSPPDKTPNNAGGCSAGSSSTQSVPPTVELNALAMKLGYTVVYTPINSSNSSSTPSSPIRSHYNPLGPAYSSLAGYTSHPSYVNSMKFNPHIPDGGGRFGVGLPGGGRFGVGAAGSGRFGSGVPTGVSGGGRFIRGQAGFTETDPSVAAGTGYNRPHSATQRYGGYHHSLRQCRVSVRVGETEFMGEGSTMQAARHSAAANALRVLRSSSAESSTSKVSGTSEVKGQGKVGVEVKDSVGGVKHESEVKEAGVQGQDSEVKDTVSCGAGTTTAALSVVAVNPLDLNRNRVNNSNAGSEIKNCNKSEISLVHEIALRRNLSITFEVIKEAGPPHLRTFVTRCTCVGEVELSGDGVASSKQLSKRKAAESMLQQLSELSPLPTPSPTHCGTGPGLTAKLKRQSRYKQNKSKSIIKVSAADYGAGVNPVSRLAQVQQIKKEREPAYELIEEKGLPRCREFIMKVSVGDHSCTASGTCKKVAKRNAAEQMLQLLGYSKPVTPQPIKSVLRTSSESSSTNGMTGDRRVKFHEELEDESEAAAARLLVPGVILRSSELNSADSSVEDVNTEAAMLDGSSSTSQGASNSKASIIISELRIHGGSSPMLEAMMRAEQKLACGEAVSDEESEGAGEQMRFRPKDKLLYLASVLGFHVQFTDFPKGNKSHYLSIATLSTTPPQHSHGSAPSIDEANDSAALLALKNLAEFGLDGSGCVTHHAPSSCCHSTNRHQRES